MHCYACIFILYTGIRELIAAENFIHARNVLTILRYPAVSHKSITTPLPHRHKSPVGDLWQYSFEYVGQSC